MTDPQTGNPQERHRSVACPECGQMPDTPQHEIGGCSPSTPEPDALREGDRKLAEAVESGNRWLAEAESLRKRVRELEGALGEVACRLEDADREAEFGDDFEAAVDEAVRIARAVLASQDTEESDG